MNEKDWLDDLRVGDQICYHDRYHGYVFETIEKITPTKQIKTKHYTFKDGYCKGVSAWDGGKRLEPITQRILDTVRAKKLLSEINEFRFEKLNLEQLEKLHAVIKGFARSASDSIEPPSAAAAEGGTS